MKTLAVTINMKTLAVLLAIATLGMAQHCQTFRCPDKLGDCNDCTQVDGQVVALTRNLCGNEYSKNKCQRNFKGNRGLSDDGCNVCQCGDDAVMCTLMACPPYDQEACISEHGQSWDCGGSTCHCTDCGVAFS